MSESVADRERNGLAAAVGAYLLWGLLPVYFKVLEAVPTLEILAHRVIWAVPFGAFIIALRSQWTDVRRALAEPRTLAFLALSSSFIAANWFVYIYAVQQDQVFQASLGYYINPLFNVAVGVAVFHERLRRPQVFAIAMAATGVTILAGSGAVFPWMSLFLAASFTCYAVIRKQVVIGGMPGLFVETLFLLPAGLLYLGWLMQSGDAVFWVGDNATSWLLLLAGPFTVVPLLLFALAARRLPLTTIGVLQFIAPSLQFIVGIAYGEALTVPHLICFSCIWVAISVFVWDAWTKSRRFRALGPHGSN